MIKLFSLLIFAPVLFCFVISKPFDSQENISLATTPTPPRNTPPKVKKIHLNKNKTTLPCPPGSRTPEFCSDDFRIGVQIDAVDAENDVIVYEYKVSGGRIIGQGAKVKWDLSGVHIGVYELAAVVDDGGVRSEPESVSVEVRECDNCDPHLACVCPTIAVVGPASAIEPGKAATFKATISGDIQNDVTYVWTISNGSIIKGQGTPIVEILQKNPDEVTTATVKIGGLCEECENTASASYIVATNFKNYYVK